MGALRAPSGIHAPFVIGAMTGQTDQHREEEADRAEAAAHAVRFKSCFPRYFDRGTASARLRLRCGHLRRWC